ncbi:DUF5691 domain-containing protein [Massilia sp. S19_KUP03_FR1]|uniref:DUF5691 domain-containing protein n=1 Tax=Massilia sp. S19_KUP03_FR1 TaxID=3025503 RepID=UPI002FCDB024
MSFSPVLHKALLAGAARVPLGDDSVDAALHGVLANAPAPLRLWHLVAATDLWQRAGLTPQHSQAQAAPCPPGPTCPRAAERVLQLILAGMHSEQLPHWLALARQHDMKVPHGLLVPLLELGMQKPAVRADLAPLLGQRGHWLVAQHPDWSAQYGVAADLAAPETHWQLGTLAQRCAALLAMRRSDPAAALATLASAWASEPPEQRVAFLAVLSTGLGLADEAFLEGVLDDKRKEVRTLAQQLLAALPGSQLVERCKTRLAGIFRHAPPELLLTLPDACDKAMKRDGIGVDAQRGLGEKAGWLFDLMRSVPPAHWRAAWQLAPEDVVALCARHEFSVALLGGLVQACARTLGDLPTREAIEWYVLLASAELPAATRMISAAVLARDMQRLPLPDQERIVLRWLAAPGNALRADAPALEWAERRAGATADPLPLDLSLRMLAGAQHAMRAVAQPGYEAQHGFRILGRTLNPAVLATAQANWPAPDWEHWPRWRDPVDQLVDTLQFRLTMHAGFLEMDE